MITISETDEHFVIQADEPIGFDYLIFLIRKAEREGYTDWVMPQEVGEIRFSK